MLSHEERYAVVGATECFHIPCCFDVGKNCLSPWPVITPHYKEDDFIVRKVSNDVVKL